VTVQGLVNWRDNGAGGRSDGQIMVGLPIPAWNRNQGGITQAYNEVVAAERGLEQLELDLQNRLAPVYERYANSQNQVQRYRTRILPAARDTLDLTRQLYEKSEIDYITLLTAQRTYSQTSLNYLDALRELRASEIELQGMLLRGSLEAR
jgi:outer membrane protein, heavy metal efflux system